MRYAETRGTLDGVQPIRIAGIVDASGTVIACRVHDGGDDKPFSWALTERQRAQFTDILQASVGLDT